MDGGSGSESEVYYGMENGAGNVVLIKYDPDTAGEDTISGFYYRSYSAGCAGLIIYNADGDVLQEAAFKTSSYYKIPVAFVSAEDGAYLMGLCGSGKKAVMTAYDNAYYFATEDREDIASCFFILGPDAHFGNQTGVSRTWWPYNVSGRQHGLVYVDVRHFYGDPVCIGICCVGETVYSGVRNGDKKIFRNSSVKRL